jgi:hypothetical protein
MTGEPVFSGSLKLKVIALNRAIIPYFRRILFVTRTPPSIALE